MVAYLFLKDRRKERDLSALLTVIMTGSQGDAEAVNKQLEKWADQ